MSTPPADRSRWMSILALGALDALEAAWQGLADKPEYRFLRKPETGLAMVRARAGNNGPMFNLGEMTMTRCSVAVQESLTGHAFVAGRNPRHAELAAVFDAMLQSPAHGPRLETILISPLEEELHAKRVKSAAEVAPTRVDFFTLVRGED